METGLVAEAKPLVRTFRLPVAVSVHNDASPSRLPRPRSILFLILGVSALLRISLVLGGGAGYTPDEDRYLTSRTAAAFVESGRLGSAWRSLDHPDHLLFKVIGMIPALAERHLPQFPQNPYLVPALFFSLVSVFNLYLVWRLVLLLGGEEREALFAAGLLACTTTFFYYSRHLVPYDLGMTFGLLALGSALRPAPTVRTSCFCGLWGILCFLTYVGYWSLALLAFLLHATWGRPTSKTLLRRAFLVCVSAAAPFYALASLSALRGGNLLGGFVKFSGTVTQGWFTEGGSLPWEYFWHAEHGLLVLWGAGVLGSAWLLLENRACARIRVGLAGLLILYALFVVNSMALQTFVVYGRLARQLAPFLCIMTAACLHRALKGEGWMRHAVWPVSVLVLLQAALNFHVPLTQTFPETFRHQAAEIQAGMEGRRTEVWYAGHFYLDGILPMTMPDKSRPHEVLLKAEHPMQYLPYQYEGHNPLERGWLRKADIPMRLVVLPGALPR